MPVAGRSYQGSTIISSTQLGAGQNDLGRGSLVDDASVGSQPIVVLATNQPQFYARQGWGLPLSDQNFGPVYRGSLQDASVLTTPGPIVVTFPGTSQFYRQAGWGLPQSDQNLGPTYRNDLVDPVVPTVPTPGPIVLTSPGSAFFYKQSGFGLPESDQNLGPVYRSTLQDPPVLTTPGPVVIASPAPVEFFRQQGWGVPESDQNFGPAYRSTLQDPPVLTTPPPVVVASPSPPQFYRQQGQGIPTQDQNLGPVYRSTLQDPPILTTQEPTVVTAPVPKAWTATNHPFLFQAPAAPPPPPLVPSTLPVVVSATRPAQFLFKQGLISRGYPVFVPDTRTPLQLSGTLTETNLLGGTVARYTIGGTASNANNLGGSVARYIIDGSAVVVDPQLGGTTVVADPVTSTLVEWTMQEVDITLAEFNDETLALTLTSGGAALNITGLELDLYLKPLSGIPDSTSGVTKLSTTTGEITITNGPGGLATVAIPKTDLGTVTAYTFYRVDVIAAGKANTAIFGKVSTTPL